MFEKDTRSPWFGLGGWGVNRLSEYGEDSRYCGQVQKNWADLNDRSRVTEGTSLDNFPNSYDI